MVPYSAASFSRRSRRTYARWSPSEKGGLHLIQELDRRGRLFSGTSLAVVLGVLRDELQESIESVEVVSPWLWQFLEGRSALVYAVTFHPHLASP